MEVKTGSSSSSSGTTGSTTYYCTSSGSGSHLCSSSTDAAAIHLDLSLGLHNGVCWRERETDEEKMQHIRSLVQDFFAESSVNCGVSGGDMGAPVVERWLKELGVGWVLSLPRSASAACELEIMFDAAGSTWIQALREIVDTVSLTESLFPDHGSVDVDMEMPSIFEEEQQQAEGEEEEDDEDEEAEAVSSVPDGQLQFARFIQETMLKMLSFVDVLVATAIVDPNGSNGVSARYQMLNVLLPVRGALSDALSEMGEVSFFPAPAPSPEIERLLRAKDCNARDAIWTTMEQIRTRILLEGIRTPHETSDIHKITRSVMAHVNFLLNNYSALHPIVSEAASLGKYVPQTQIGGLPHLDSMALEITSCLEEVLSKISESFADQGLRLLFLLNNSDFMVERLQDNTLNSSIHARVAELSSKVECYMERYLRVSWAPLLPCLLDPPAPLCLFGKYYYPPALPKFESEFQKTYTSQKLWKVPDLELKTKLRMAVIDRIVPVYTEYIEGNKTTTPKFTPEEMEEMLQELFEGS